MSRFLQYFNLAGVIILVVLCSVQWTANRQLNLDVISLEKTQQEQAAKLAQQDQRIKGSAADLDEFREHLRVAKAALKEAESKQVSSSIEHAQLVAERDQLKASLGKWTVVVAARDAALKQAGEQIQTLASERNNVVTKFNELANRYNALVKEANAASTKP